MIRRVGLLACFLLVAAAHVFSYARLERVRMQAARSSHIQHIKPIMPPALARLAAGEFKGLMADFMTLEASSGIGYYLLQQDIKMHDIPPEAWDVIYELLEISQKLDPYFSDNYRIVQPFFTWAAQRPQQAISFLKKGMDARDWDWELPFFIGFDYFFFLDDNLQASHYLQEAYSRPSGKGSITLATLSAKLLQKSGKTEVGIAYLTALLQEELNETQRNAFEMRLNDLRRVLVVEKAVAAYQVRFGHPPENTEALLRAGILSAIPENSYDKTMPYCIDQTGKVFFDKPGCRETAALHRSN
ncbi:MAG: hypothetical protein ACOY3Z_13665 [Thermodesulfobacteriota bacterium]